MGPKLSLIDFIICTSIFWGIQLIVGTTGGVAAIGYIVTLSLLYLIEGIKNAWE